MNSFVDSIGREWVRPLEACRRLPHIPLGTFRQWVHRKHIVQVKDGKHAWWLWESVLEQERKTRSQRNY